MARRPLRLTETTRMTMTAPDFPFRPAGAALVLLAAGLLLAPGGAARAQLNPQELLKQVLPGGGTQDRAMGDRGSAASGPASATPRTKGSTCGGW